ncbi:MAG: porin family protein [Acidobacteriia bacterium]|nr:porin family protein [Terriglobia bacterium]
MRFFFPSLCLLIFASLSPAISQSLSVGIKAGARLGDEFNGSVDTIHDESKRYAVGPMLDLRLPLRLGIELDALYQPLGYTVHTFDFDFFHSLTIRERSSSWYFPIIAKYRLPGAARVAPYVGVGYAPRIVHGSQSVNRITYDVLTGNIRAMSSSKRDTNYDTTHGLVIEGGLHLPVSRLFISPELRYTRWKRPFLNAPDLPGIYSSQQDQVEILFGLTWH